jgi:hypothetical protein
VEKKWKKHENDGEKGDLWDEILGHCEGGVVELKHTDGVALRLPWQHSVTAELK